MAAFFSGYFRTTLRVNTLQFVFDFDGGLSIQQNVMSKYAVHTFRTWIFELWNCSNETFPWWWCAHTFPHKHIIRRFKSIFVCALNPWVNLLCTMQRNPGIYMFNFEKMLKHFWSTRSGYGIVREVNGAQSACSVCADELKFHIPLKAPFMHKIKHDAIRWKVNEFLIDFLSHWTNNKPFKNITEWRAFGLKCGDAHSKCWVARNVHFIWISYYFDLRAVLSFYHWHFSLSINVIFTINLYHRLIVLTVIVHVIENNLFGIQKIKSKTNTNRIYQQNYWKLNETALAGEVTSLRISLTCIWTSNSCSISCLANFTCSSKRRSYSHTKLLNKSPYSWLFFKLSEVSTTNGCCWSVDVVAVSYDCYYI